MAKYQEISIGALERGVRTLAKKLEAMGLQTEIHVFKTGPGGAQHYGPSHVELTAKGTYIDTDGHEEEAWATVKFIAGGYGNLHGQRGEIGGTEGWRAMREQGFTYIMNSLKSQGWHGAVENPWTPPSAFWPRYQLRIEPAESYRTPDGRRIVHKWRVVLMTADPDSPKPLFTEVGFARGEDAAEKIAFDYARNLHAKEPRNPNDIRVYNERGQCVWSLHGTC